jgi:hypothetical protein
MADVFNEMNAALRQAAEGLLRAVELAQVAHDEHEDLRVTVHRLEELVMEQTRNHSAELRALRADVQALRNRLPPEA